MVYVNPHRGEAELDLGGRTRVLKIDFNALARIEQSLGVSFLLGSSEQQEKLEHVLSTVNGVRVAVAEGLSTERQRVDPNKVGEWMSEPGKLLAASEAVGKALSRFFSGLSLKPVDEGEPARPTSEAGAVRAPASGGQG